MENSFSGKKIGIWGFGRVGKSAINYFSPFNCPLSVFDDKKISKENQKLLAEKKVILWDQEHLCSFLRNNEQIVPSPGIDLRPYNSYKRKWLSELDLFAQAWHKPYIAITGSVGKTTITHLLEQLTAQYNLKTVTGGNIGTPMLDLISQQNNVDKAILEVSSFQLELCRSFAPDLAIWTNFYPNHLDRHGTINDYFAAKSNLLNKQNKEQQALIPIEIALQLANSKKITKKKFPPAETHVFSITPLLKNQIKKMPSMTSFFFLENKAVFCQKQNGQTEKVAQLSPELLDITFEQNWIIICAALSLQGLSCTSINKKSSALSLPAHRLEKIATIKNIDFYNDSKSTTTASTRAAIDKLAQKPIILFLGGLSKGIDRKEFICSLPDTIKAVICFGAEAEALASHCLQQGIKTRKYPDLKTAFQAAIEIAQAGDQFLFSPAGSSFDLYQSYQSRGDCFKKLVNLHREKFS